MEENRTDFGKANHKPRSKKLKPTIDLTAMVSVSFLLIAFFMTAAELAKPRTIELGLPDNGCGIHHYGGCSNHNSNRIITLLLDDDNKIISYFGLLAAPNEPIKKLNYGKDSIRKELLHKSKIIKAYDLQNGRRIPGAIVIIKPSKECNYGNLVDILDEMHIADIGTYAIINDFTPEERALLVAN
jgi:biopolymer transport protein ExbD